MFTLAFVLVSIIAGSHASNDWNTPCTSGACGYTWDGDGEKVAFSSMMLAGPNQIISDITPAAGWQIMGCDPNWSEGSHDIRMVCAGAPEQVEHCQHLFDNGGAEETVVRLPQNCGTGPFARVQKTHVPEDQSMPENVSKLPRRATDSTQPVVRGLTLDYDFNQVPNSRGKLLLAVASSNVGVKPLTRRDLMNLHKRGRAGALAQRGFFDSVEKGVTGTFDKVKDKAGDVVDDAKSVVGGAAKKVTSVAGSGFSKATSAVASVATKAADAVVKGVKEIKDATTINKTDTGELPINFDQTFTLLDAAIGCEANKVSGSASLHIDVDTKVNADIKFGYTFVGSVVPLKLEDVKVFSTMSGDASATFNIDASAQGTFDTDNVPLFKTGLPALSIPGIAALGPEFSLNGRLDMELDVEAQMSVTADFAFPNVELVFPQKSGKSSAKANPKKAANPLKLSTQANVEVTGTVTAHIIPRVDFGIDIGNGLAKATVFLDMDFAGILGMEVHTSGGASKTIGAADAANAPAKNDTEAASGTTSAKAAPASGKSKATAAKATAAKATAAKATSAKASGAAKSTPKTSSKPVQTKTVTRKPKTKRANTGGCVTLTGKMSINGGLDGSLEPLFDKEVRFPIFSTQAELFKKCFGAPAARSISGGSTVARMYNRPRAAKSSAAKASGGTKNEITPKQSKASTKNLSCESEVLPFGVLTALI